MSGKQGSSGKRLIAFRRMPRLVVPLPGEERILVLRTDENNGLGLRIYQTIFGTIMVILLGKAAVHILV